MWHVSNSVERHGFIYHASLQSGAYIDRGSHLDGSTIVDPYITLTALLRFILLTSFEERT